MTSNSRRFILRQHTATAHAAVDEAVGGFSDLTGYKAYLKAIAAFRGPIEAQLTDIAWPAALGEWRPRSISAAIAADMADLGLTAHPVDASALTFGGDRLFGALYVLEGSALGARVLMQQAKDLGLSASFGARHLALLGGDIDNWRSFLDRLEEAEPFDLDGALAGSLSAFALARQAFATA